MALTESQGTGLLASILSDESFRPSEPRSLEETGLSASMIESLVLKLLLVIGTCSGRNIAERVCIPFGLIEHVLKPLRQRQYVMHTGSTQLNDYYYALTEHGQERAKSAMDSCAYVGAAPVPLDDYIVSVEAQSIRAESPRRDDLAQAFEGLSIEPDLFDNLGPAVNSGAGMFLYGAAGNGKTTLATRMTQCYHQSIWIPQTIIEDGQLIKLFDASFHEPIERTEDSILKSAEHDHRWVKVKRPTVVVGGELTMDNLEIRHDPRSNISEASLQLKSNCGCLLIDDFGRQRMEPQELLNRWIVPLESHVDYLTIATGKKIQVPFDQLIIFSTNLEPSDLTDEAFLRRIPYKIEVGDPSEKEFHELFKIFSKSFGCEYDGDAVEYLIQHHYRVRDRALRRCHPRDLLGQIRNYCVYNDFEMRMSPDAFDRVVKSYFTVVAGG